MDSTDEVSKNYNLRKRTLKVLNEINDCKARILFKDGSECNGIMLGGETEMKKWIIQDLSTPLGTYKKALIRSSDMKMMEIGLERKKILEILTGF